MASALFWGPLKLPAQTTIRLALLFHRHGIVAPHQRAIRQQRRLNLAREITEKLALGWHLDI